MPTEFRAPASLPSAISAPQRELKFEVSFRSPDPLLLTRHNHLFPRHMARNSLLRIHVPKFAPDT